MSAKRGEKQRETLNVPSPPAASASTRAAASPTPDTRAPAVPDRRNKRREDKGKPNGSQGCSEREREQERATNEVGKKREKEKRGKEGRSETNRNDPKAEGRIRQVRPTIDRGERHSY